MASGQRDLPLERVSGKLWARSTRFLARIETAEPSPDTAVPPGGSEVQPEAVNSAGRTSPHSALRPMGRLFEESPSRREVQIIARLPSRGNHPTASLRRDCPTTRSTGHRG